MKETIESDDTEISDYDDQFKLPHNLKLEENYLEENNFFNATIHCLTNIRNFWLRVYKYKNNEQDNNQKSFYEFINLVSGFISKNNKEVFNPKQFCNSILSDEKLFKIKENHDPRVLIDCILNYFLKEKIENNNDNKNDNKNNNKNDNDNDNKSKILNFSNEYNDLINSFSLNISNLESKDYEPYKYKIILKKTRICSNLKCRKQLEFYKSFSTLHFNLNYNKEKTYSIYDCFKYYLDKENEKIDYICPLCNQISKIESNSFFYYLTNPLIIFIYFGDEQKSYQDFYYKFEEIIDFSLIGFVKDNIKNKKYFLSSVIACKHPKEEEELFYTFCRKDLESPFWVYNSRDVRGDIKKVSNKIIKLKDEKINENRSFPYVLIYTEL